MRASTLISTLVGGLCVAAAPAAIPQPTGLQILSPVNGALVSAQQEVSGVAPAGVTEVWVVVHPLEDSNCWVQTAGLVSGGRWTISAHFGNLVPAHVGKRFEMRAMARPASVPRAGATACWPAAAVVSNAVVVTRR